MKKIIVVVFFVLTAGCNSMASSESLDSRAESGDAVSQFALGMAYYDGSDGHTKNDELSIYWLKKAANQNYSIAMRIVGMRYLRGISVNQDYGEAERWLEKAANKGEEIAQLNLGFMFEGSYEQVLVDYKRAAYWLTKAANQGNSFAAARVAEMYRDGLGVRQNNSIAKEWFGKLCDIGDQAGCDEYAKINSLRY